MSETSTGSSDAAAAGASIRIEGWPLVGWVTALVAVSSLGVLGFEGLTAEGYGLGARVTLRVGFLCFLAALVASSIPHFGANANFKWILRNRRYLGVSFAVAHFFHFLFVWALVESGAIQLDGSFLQEPGLAIYLLLALMVATSFDATAAMLPRRVWVGLHRVGMYATWFAFFGAFAGRSAEGDLFYHPFTLACVLGMGVRWWVTFARWRRRRA